MIRLVNPPPYQTTPYDCQRRAEFEVDQCNTTGLRFKTNTPNTGVVISIYNTDNYVYRNFVVTDANGFADFLLSSYDLKDFNAYREAFEVKIHNPALFETSNGTIDTLWVKFIEII